MASYTQNYQLHQWVPEDNFLRMDFNEDFKKIDTAIKSVETGLQANLDSEVSRLDEAIATAQQALRNEYNGGFQSVNTTLAALQQTLNRKLEIITGSFVGDYGENRLINLGFQPSFVIFGAANFRYDGRDGYNTNCIVIYPGVLCDGNTGNQNGSAQIVSSGFQVSGVSNYEGTTYQYIAFRTV